MSWFSKEKHTADNVTVMSEEYCFLENVSQIHQRSPESRDRAPNGYSVCVK